jgi:hypothetical protein
MGAIVAAFDRYAAALSTRDIPLDVHTLVIGAITSVLDLCAFAAHSLPPRPLASPIWVFLRFCPNDSPLLGEAKNRRFNISLNILLWQATADLPPSRTGQSLPLRARMRFDQPFAHCVSSPLVSMGATVLILSIWFFPF